MSGFRISVKGEIGERAILILLCLSALIVYVNSLGNSFIWDDKLLIIANPYIKSWHWLKTLFTKDLYCFWSPVSNFYRPLQSLSYLLDYSLYKTNPFGYHLTNFLFHLGNGIFIYLLTRSLSRNRILSLITSLLFLLHPIQTQAITYISGRADPLATFFLLLSFFLFLKSGKKGFYLGAVLSYIFALLSKETAIIFPFLLILYHYCFERRSSMKRYLPFFLILGLYIALRLSVFNFGEGSFLQCKTSLYLRLLTFSKVIIVYLKLLFFPCSLYMKRSIPIANSFFQTEVLLAIFLLVLIGIGMIKLFKVSKPSFFGLSWFFIALLPVSNIVPLNAIMAEHWLYLPSIGFFLALAAGIIKFSELKMPKVSAKFWRGVSFSLIILLLICYSLRTISRNREWRNEIFFFQRTLQNVPNNTEIICNLGSAYQEQGLYKRAMAEYLLAIKLNPKSAGSFSNLGYLYHQKGEDEKAIKSCQEALKLKPALAEAYVNLGTIYADRNNYEEAINQLKKALKIRPDYPTAHNNLAIYYAVKKPPEIDLAKKHCQCALKLGYPIHPEFLKYLKELEAKSQKD